MNYWLVKSEPGKWSWDDQVKAKTTHWDGVRNYMATINLKAMRIGDDAFFYHSNEGKEIVGIVEISKEFYLDPNDPSGRFGMVDVTAVEKLPTPVTLAQIKADPKLSEMILVKNSRLSVQPVTPAEWKYITSLAGLKK
ncbi:MAG: Ubiquinol-cytochrome reductase [Rhodospirillales bacterium]|nr:Ubiquinol-cytochrome reductase [Rhodospirillales bacterium]